MGTTSANIAGGCGIEGESKIKDTPVGCEFALPLCVKGNGTSSDFEMFCVTTGRFRITANDVPKAIDAVFLGGSPPAVAPVGSRPPRT